MRSDVRVEDEFLFRRRLHTVQQATTGDARQDFALSAEKLRLALSRMFLGYLRSKDRLK